MTEVRTRCYRKGVLDDEGFPLDNVSEHLDNPDSVVWIDCPRSADQLQALADELGWHELALEDALEDHERPKLDHYATHLFLTTHAVAVAPDRSGLVVQEIDLFIGDRWLVTVRNDEGFSMQPVLDRWDRSPDLATEGVPFLVYGVLDVVVDGYFDAVQDFDDFYDDVSDQIFSQEHPLLPEQGRRWFEMRRALVKFHRLVVPIREVVSGLMRREQASVPEKLYPYYQDVYDHILRVTETTDSLRDLVGNIVETNLSLRDYRQNVVMKKVTSWAAIIAVPTLITGFYGMNVPYPGFARHSGVYLSSALIVVLSATLFAVFRKKDWL